MENSAGSWKDLKSLFEKLNEECNYLILRNYENMDQEDFFCDGHEDIDILCDDCDQFIKAAKAVRMYGEDIHLYVVVDNEKICVDLRCVGDDYYDANWQKDMLKARTLVTTNMGSWYVMSDEDYYYSLTYHAFLQKKEVSPDYYPKLQSLAEKIGIKISESNMHIANLISFMQEKQYYFPYPSDISVPLNVNYVPSNMVRGEVEAWNSGRNIEYPADKRIKVYVSAQRIGRRLKEYFSHGKKAAFIWAVLAGITVQLSGLWQGALYGGEYANEYNIGIRVFSLIRGGKVLYGTIMLLSLLFLGGTAVLLVDLFKIKGRLNAGLVGGILAVSPLIAGIYLQYPIADCILAAQFLSVLAVRISFSNRKGHMLVCIALMAAVALSTPELLWMSAILFMVVIMRKLAANEKISFGTIGSGALFAALIAVLLFFDISMIMLWEQMDPQSIFYLLKEARAGIYDVIRLAVYVYDLIVAIYLSIKVWKLHYPKKNIARSCGMFFAVIIVAAAVVAAGFLGEMLAAILITAYLLSLSEESNRYSILKIVAVVGTCVLIWNHSILTGTIYSDFIENAITLQVN